MAIAEFIGTFALIFVGAGSIISSQGMDDPLLVIALAHGLTIAVMVSATAHISGAHFNPAVTFGALVGRQITFRVAVLYWVTQLLAALVAAITLLGVFPAGEWLPSALGTPRLAPAVGVGSAILVEAVLTFFLAFVIYGTAIDPKGSFHAVGGLAIGFTLALGVLMAGPLTGGALNPARWFGTAVVAGALENALVYVVGPVVGAAVAGLLYANVFLRKTT